MLKKKYAQAVFNSGAVFFALFLCICVLFPLCKTDTTITVIMIFKKISEYFNWIVRVFFQPYSTLYYVLFNPLDALGHLYKKSIQLF